MSRDAFSSFFREVRKSLGLKELCVREARLEEIAEHGRPVSFRKAVHKSKKVYDRKRLKQIEQKLSDKSE